MEYTAGMNLPYNIEVSGPPFLCPSIPVGIWLRWQYRQSGSSTVVHAANGG